MGANLSLRVLLGVGFALFMASIGASAAILEISPTNQTIVRGQTAQFSAQVTGDATPPFSFSWAGPSAFSSQNQSINVTNAGKYSVTATDAVGQSFGAVCATLNVKLVPTVTVANATLTCSQVKVALKAETTALGATYSWTGPGIVSGEGTATPVVNLPGTYVVTMTALNGCTATAGGVVNEDKNPPSLSVSSSGLLSATNTTVFLQAYSTNNNIYFLWTGTGIVSGSRSNICAVNRPGVYTVTAFTPQFFGLIAKGSISNWSTNVVFESYDPSNGVYSPYNTNFNSDSLPYDTNLHSGYWTNIEEHFGPPHSTDPCPEVTRGAIIDQNNVTNFVEPDPLGLIVIPGIYTNGHFSFYYDESLTSSNYYANGCSSTATVTVESDGTFGFISKITRTPALNGAPNDKRHVIAWPTNLAGFTLQSASNLTSWTDLSNSPALVDGQFVVTNSPAGTVQFYRLKK